MMNGIVVAGSKLKKYYKTKQKHKKKQKKKAKIGEQKYDAVMTTVSKNRMSAVDVVLLRNW